VFRFLYIGKTSAGANHTDNKKQNKQGKTDSLNCSVDIHHYRPNTAAFELLRRSG
jgi:hypothetical protein